MDKNIRKYSEFTSSAQTTNMNNNRKRKYDQNNEYKKRKQPDGEIFEYLLESLSRLNLHRYTLTDGVNWSNWDAEYAEWCYINALPHTITLGKLLMFFGSRTETEIELQVTIKSLLELDNESAFLEFYQLCNNLDIEVPFWTKQKIRYFSTIVNC